MLEQDMDISLKVIVVGNGMVGKTSLITRFARGIRTDQYKKTIGTDFMEKEIHLKSRNETVKLMLWDTAGQEMFSKLTRSYYKGAGAVVYAFSTVDRESFLEIERWRQKVVAECGDICSVLVQNKVDLLDQAVVTPNEVEDLARKLGIKLYRICVKDNLLVDDVFEYLCESFLARGGTASLDEDAVGHIEDPEYNGNEENGPGAGRKASIASDSASPRDGGDPSPTEGFNGQVDRPKAGGVVALAPITQRTGGKKKQKCTIM